MKLKSVWLVMSLIILLVVSGCSSKSTPSSAEPESSEEFKTMNIGYTGPLSGGGALFGKDVTEGLDMAIDEINEKGLMVDGQKYKLNLVKLDDQYMPDKAATNARRLVNERETPVIFVPHSGGAFALQQFNKDDGFLIMAYTSEGKVAEAGNELTVVMTTPYKLYPEVYSQKVMQKFGKRLALIPTSSTYGKDWSEAIIPAWEKLGGTIVANTPVDYNKEVDFNTYVSKALVEKPDVMFVGGPSQPTAMVIKQARQLGYEGGFILMDQAKVEQMESVISLEELEGTVCLTPAYLYNSPGTASFVERFKAKYNGKVPAWEASKNYDNMILLARGIEKAGSTTDATKILEGMRGVTPLDDPLMMSDIPGIAIGGGSMTPGTGIMVENGEYGEQFDIVNPANTTGK